MTRSGGKAVTHLSSKAQRLQIPLPGGSGRAPTGAVQFRDDWPGLFIRGDDAVMIAFSIRQLQQLLAHSDDLQVASALGRLSDIADLIERDVKFDPDES